MNTQDIYKGIANVGKMKEFHKVARSTDGYGDRGGVFGIIANNPNPDFQLGICGYRDAKHTSEYLNRDSVAQFTQINGANATITYNNTDIEYTVNTAKFPTMSDTDFDKIKVGMVVDTLHRPNQWTGIIKSLDKANKTIIMDEGFYQVGNNETTTIPTVGVGLQINIIGKIYSYNSITHIPHDCETHEAMAMEIDLFKDKEEGNIGGIDMVNMGRKAMFGMYTHKAFDGDGFIYGNITEDCEVGWEHRWNETQGHLPMMRSKINGDTLGKGFSIYNDGTMSKFKGFITVIDNIGKQIALGTTTVLFRLAQESNYIFTAASEAEIGSLRIVKNIGTKNVTLTDCGFFKDSLKNSLTLKKGDSYVLQSDGITWNIVAEYNNTPKGYEIIKDTIVYPYTEDVDTLIVNGTKDINIDIYALKDLKSGTKIYVKNMGTNPCMLWNSGFYTNDSTPKETLVIEIGQSKTLISNGENGWFVI